MYAYHKKKKEENCKVLYESFEHNVGNSVHIGPVIISKMTTDFGLESRKACWKCTRKMMHKSSITKTYHTKGVFQRIKKLFSMLSLFWCIVRSSCLVLVEVDLGKDRESFNLSLIFSVFSTGISSSLNWSVLKTWKR